MASSKDILKADEVARMEAGAKAEAPMKEARMARARNMIVLIMSRRLLFFNNGFFALRNPDLLYMSKKKVFFCCVFNNILFYNMK